MILVPLIFLVCLETKYLTAHSLSLLKILDSGDHLITHTKLTLFWTPLLYCLLDVLAWLLISFDINSCLRHLRPSFPPSSITTWPSDTLRIPQITVWTEWWFALFAMWHLFGCFRLSYHLQEAEAGYHHLLNNRRKRRTKRNEPRWNPGRRGGEVFNSM